MLVARIKFDIWQKETQDAKPKTECLATHLLLGSSNLLYWSSFVKQDLLAVGVVTTTLHIIFVIAQAICWRRERA